MKFNELLMNKNVHNNTSIVNRPEQANRKQTASSCRSVGKVRVQFPVLAVCLCILSKTVKPRV